LRRQWPIVGAARHIKIKKDEIWKPDDNPGGVATRTPSSARSAFFRAYCGKDTMKTNAYKLTHHEIVFPVCRNARRAVHGDGDGAPRPRARRSRRCLRAVRGTAKVTFRQRQKEQHGNKCIEKKKKKKKK